MAEVTNFIASKFIDDKLFFSNKEDKKNIRDNVLGANDARKFQLMAVHLLNLGYELVIVPLSNAGIIPWMHAAMSMPPRDQSKGYCLRHMQQEMRNLC